MSSRRDDDIIDYGCSALPPPRLSFTSPLMLRPFYPCHSQSEVLVLASTLVLTLTSAKAWFVVFKVCRSTGCVKLSVRDEWGNE